MLENLPWLGLAFFVHFGGHSLFKWQLKLGQLCTVHAVGGPMFSNLPSSFLSNCPAALSLGRFGNPLGKLQGLFTFQYSRDMCFFLCYRPQGGAGWPVGLCSMVITEGHGFAGAWIAQE